MSSTAQEWTAKYLASTDEPICEADVRFAYESGGAEARSRVAELEAEVIRARSMATCVQERRWCDLERRRDDLEAALYEEHRSTRGCAKMRASDECSVCTLLNGTETQGKHAEMKKRVEQDIASVRSKLSTPAPGLPASFRCYPCPDCGIEISGTHRDGCPRLAWTVTKAELESAKLDGFELSVDLARQLRELSGGDPKVAERLIREATDRALRETEDPRKVIAVTCGGCLREFWQRPDGTPARCIECTARSGGPTETETSDGN